MISLGSAKGGLQIQVALIWLCISRGMKEELSGVHTDVYLKEEWAAATKGHTNAKVEYGFLSLGTLKNESLLPLQHFHPVRRWLPRCEKLRKRGRSN